MAREPFRFALEPELVVRSAERDRVEQEVLELARTLRAEQERRDSARAALAGTAQRRARAADDLFVPPRGESLDAALLLARSQFLDELRALEERQSEELAERERAVVLAQHKLRAGREQLAELASRVEALERARQREHQAWRAEREKLAEKARDEDAILRWTHEKRSRDR